MRTIDLELDDIIAITSAPANPEERQMLDRLARIDSLIQPKEALALFRLCRRLSEPAQLLEIGSFQGASTVALGHAILGKNTNIFCIDKWADYLQQKDFQDFGRERIADDMKIMRNFIANTLFIDKQLRMLRGESKDFEQMLKGQMFDFIFIDGAHDYESVAKDIRIAFSALKPGGFLCGHDYHNMGHGVREAVNKVIVSAETIPIKGCIKETTLWFAVIDEPQYEHMIAEIYSLHDSGDISGALQVALKANTAYKNDELPNIISNLKLELYKTEHH
ncbi:class I SAM-dependent methyltransferase [Geobacter sp. SVR]|uniref:class I SAM-dependent methyltransferase n=1 Tax=Geobacter sp. SVR TaxID=2495594 RepID=UPI00143F03ED|nr:class I SAM-dependent methyltransferase [Geobacter sp. SVR]BCS55994.1 hypothetical protein GSVR_43020 [Geobacter sp. SVR]GCF84757.1 hypothetical protein GSbR_13570 [Geobacter sp. SVR]